MRAIAALSLLALAGAAEAAVEVRAAGGRVDVRATAAPLSDVLDGLSRQTGMKVIYEGAPPRQLVTATLEGRTPAEAVLAILEGFGLNYALVMDATGTRVLTLLMAGASGAASPQPSARSQPAVPAPQPEAEPDAPEDMPPEEEPPPEEAQPHPGAPPEQPKEEPETGAAAPAPTPPFFQPFGGNVPAFGSPPPAFPAPGPSEPQQGNPAKPEPVEKEKREP